MVDESTSRSKQAKSGEGSESLTNMLGRLLEPNSSQSISTSPKEQSSKRKRSEGRRPSSKKSQSRPKGAKSSRSANQTSRPSSTDPNDSGDEARDVESGTDILDEIIDIYAPSSSFTTSSSSEES